MAVTSDHKSRSNSIDREHIFYVAAALNRYFQDFTRNSMGPNAVGRQSASERATGRTSEDRGS